MALLFSVPVTGFFLAKVRFNVLYHKILETIRINWRRDTAHLAPVLALLETELHIFLKSAKKSQKLHHNTMFVYLREAC